MTLRDPQQPFPSDAALDHLLHVSLSASVDPLTPSSGFTQSVMDAVRQSTTAPEPIPFPWRRILPFALALLCVFAAFIVGALVYGPAHQTAPITHEVATASILKSLFSTSAISLASIAATIAISLAATALSIKLAAGRH